MVAEGARRVCAQLETLIITGLHNTQVVDHLRNIHDRPHRALEWSTHMRYYLGRQVDTIHVKQVGPPPDPFLPFE